MKLSEAVSVERKGNVAWVTIDNPPVNATSTDVRTGLMAAVEAVQDSRLAVLQCVGKTFIAGGDMSEFDAPAMEPHLPDVVNAIEASKTPFVALMQGNVLGGGLEIAMACAYRIAKPKTRFGLPEVNVGLVPGAGGTQRAPRLLGWDTAIEMACLGQLKGAEDLLALGAIDAIEENLQAAAESLSRTRPESVSGRNVAPLTNDARKTWTEKIQKYAKGRQAPLLNFEALQWAKEPFADAQPRERELHLKLRQSAESRALRHVFFAERAVTKPDITREGTTRDIQHVAIVGGGLMGSGIAAACLNAGVQVVIIERDEDAVAQATNNVKTLMDGALKRGKISAVQYDQRLANFTASANYDAAENVDMSVEAVFEDLDAKRTVFASLDAVMGKHAILATNTSYLDPNDIFAGISNPERCLGLHFFSPAHIMKLVEVVQAEKSQTSILASAFAFASKLRKTPVLSGVCDGFIGNRILAAYRRAAEYLLADGALPHEVDAAMRAFGMAMGPFEAQDMSGLQIAQANRRRQDATRDPQERYVLIADRLCEASRFGQRSGKGWYAYEDGARKGSPDPFVEEVIVSYSAEAGITRRPISKQDVQNQLLAVMANEGARIVEEGIADSDAAIDVVKTSGYGFPRHKGGPMHWAEHNTSEALAALKLLEEASPNSWHRAKRFQSE